jgi:hypothetical protein
MMYDPLTSSEAKTTDGVMLNGHTDFNSVSILISQREAAYFFAFAHTPKAVSHSFPQLLRPCKSLCLTVNGAMSGIAMVL